MSHGPWPRPTSAQPSACVRMQRHAPRSHTKAHHYHHAYYVSTRLSAWPCLVWDMRPMCCFKLSNINSTVGCRPHVKDMLPWIPTHLSILRPQTTTALLWRSTEFLICTWMSQHPAKHHLQHVLGGLSSSLPVWRRSMTLNRSINNSSPKQCTDWQCFFYLYPWSKCVYTEPQAQRTRHCKSFFWLSSCTWASFFYNLLNAWARIYFRSNCC